ncbi:MAG: ABC transporter ATP-binding protein [Spirochaetales bacterium]|nr:ABC transporter ATP-binding protein [Spirochaetales bacterium]
MNNTAIEVKGLSKRYKRCIAVNDLSFSVGKGEIFALLGPNGAGKTTTLECIEGLRSPDGGQISVAGIRPLSGGRRLTMAMGVQLQTQGLPSSMTPREALVFFALYRKIEPDLSIAERFGLSAKMDVPCLDLSEGQKRRLALALAVAHKPPVLILDEPTAALDVESRTMLHEIIRDLRNSGTAVLLASHDMAEVEKLADRAIVLLNGKLVIEGSPRQIRGQAGGEARICCGTEAGCLLKEEPRKIPHTEFQDYDGDLALFKCTDPGSAVSSLIKHITECGDKLTSLQVEGPTLEERFMELTRGKK